MLSLVLTARHLYQLLQVNLKRIDALESNNPDQVLTTAITQSREHVLADVAELNSVN